jgi:hypothetical protein
MFSRNKVTVAIVVAAFALAPLFASGTDAAQTNNLNAIRLSNDVVPPPQGFEAISGKYVAAKATDIYISPFIWAGKVKGRHLNAGQPVEVMAKLRGYDWLLIGNNGEGIGYVPISALSPAK